MTLTLRRRPQAVAVVVDRSGSMTGARWTHAIAAARTIVQLYAVFRAGVHDQDRIGIVAFEAPGCGWGPAAGSLTPQVLPLADPATAGASVCAAPLGVPGSCTPLGDGMIAGLDMLVSAGLPTDGRYAMVVLTDGYENSGVVQVGPSVPVTGVLRFSQASLATPARAAVTQRLALFTVGLGGTVDEPVLNNLPVTAIGGGAFLKVTDPRALSAAFGQLMSLGEEANPVPTTASAGAVTFLTASGADRLAAVVLGPAGPVSVGFRPAGSAAAFTPGPAVSSCPEVDGLAVHSLSVPDVAALGVAGAIEWQVTRPGLALSAADVLAFEDLRLKAELVLDRPQYRVGDTLRMTVHLRDGGEPVLGARVRVELVAPTQGLGEELAAFGATYRPPPGQGPDPATGKGLMLATLLLSRDLTELPTGTPRGVFLDGSDELLDPDGTGDYANDFARFDHEGTYTWRVLVDGRDVAGQPFQRLLQRSTWAGLRIDAGSSTVTQTAIPQHPSGSTAVLLVVTPRDARGRQLGPFWDDDVLFSLRDGRFEDVTTVRFDGTYARTVLYGENQIPVIDVSVLGTTFPPIVLPPGHPKDLPKDLPKDPPKELPKDPPKDRPKDLPKDLPKDPPKDRPKDPPKDLPKDRPKDQAKDRPKDLGKDRPKDLVKEPLRDTLIKDPVDDRLKLVNREEVKLVTREELKAVADAGVKLVAAEEVDPVVRLRPEEPGFIVPRVLPFTLATGPEAAAGQRAESDAPEQLDEQGELEPDA